MPVTSNNEYQSFLKVENPSQILNYFSGGQSHQQQYLFGAAVAADHLFQQIMSNDKKRLCSEIDRIERSNNANDSDSDVSVGQEKIDDNNSCKSLNNYDEKIKSSPSTVTKLKSGVVVDNLSTSIKDDDDNSSNESSSPRFGFHSNNSSSSPRITTIPQINQKLFVGNSPLFIGSSPGNFQEEILRNSQVYAGELMRHQLVAAAQLQSLSSGVQQTFPPNFETSPLSDHHPFNFVENDLQDKFPRLFSPKKVVESNTNNFLNCNNKSAISFQNIHSHLSAITQITNSFNSNSTSNHHQHHHHTSMKKDDVTSLSSLSRESSQSPSGFQQQFNKQSSQQHFSATHQNGLTDRQLKFSIDNILKADFGRRITEPLLRTSKSKKISNNHNNKIEKQTKLNFTTKANANNNNNESISPIESSINNAEKSPTSNEKNQSSSETSSNGGTVWPAWVRIYRPIIKLGVIRYLLEPRNDFTSASSVSMIYTTTQQKFFIRNFLLPC